MRTRRQPWPEKLKLALTAHLGPKLISLVIAMVLWAVVLGSRNVEVLKEVPLSVITHPDMVAANELPEKITFRLAGPKAFLRSILDRREEPIRVNLTGAQMGVVTYRFFSDNIRLPIGVKVLAITPSTMIAKLEPLKTREVPIRLELRGTPSEGLSIVKAEVKPEVVRIRGAESRVESVTEVMTQPIDISQVKNTLEREVALDLARSNVTVEGELPRAYIEVAAVTANFRIKNIDIRVLSSYKVKLDEKGVMILVRATPKDIRTLDRSQLFGVVDLRGKERGQYLETVKITLPQNMGLVKVIPERVSVILY